MKIFTYLFIALAFSFIAVFPQKASAHKHIPFYATYPEEGDAPDLWINCKGPWRNDNAKVSSGIENFEFYRAEVTIFSPYGT